MVRRVFATRFLKLAQQFLLTIGEVNRGFHHHVAKQVAVVMAANPLDALAAQAKRFSRLSLWGNTDLRHTIERRNINFSTKGSGGETDRHLAVQIVLLALKHRVRLEVNLNVEISGRATVDAVLTFA